MLVATWNVNSLVARLPRVLEFLASRAPDVLLLQETKVAPAAFPAAALADAGYDAVHHSGGRWAGVAVLAPSGRGLREAGVGLPGEVQAGEARWVEATVDGVHCVSTYVVNGRALDAPQYAEKLTFLDAMATRVAALADGPLIVAGDMNIAPQDVDVWDPSLFVGSTHTSAPERERWQRLLDAGLVDAYRHCEPDAVGFTYWDYRAGMFHRGLGMRIDAVLVSPALVPRLRRSTVDRPFRKGLKPSDHAPLLVELD